MSLGSVSSVMSRVPLALRLALAWWFLCSPVLWMWPSDRTLLDTVVSAVVLAPLFLWRRGGQLAAWLLVWVGAAYLGYFFAVRSLPDTYFWFTVMGSHAGEALEYLSTYRWQDAALWSAWVVCALWVAWWLSRHAQPVRRPWVRAVLLGIAMIWVAWCAVSAYKGDSVEATLRKINRVYPLALFESYARHRVAASQVYVVPEVPAPTAPARADLVVVVLGESASAHRWSLLGYDGHDTNAALRPLLPAMQVLPVMTSGSNTAQTVPVLLSGQPMDALPEKGLPTYLDWARAAGFKVVTLSNQSSSGTEETFFHTAYRQRSDVFLNLPDGEWDGALSEPLDEALARSDPVAEPSPLLITLHTYGSHPRTAKRYPPERAQWEDSYDNSIAYSSELLAQWIDLLQQHWSDRRVVLLYISDHGLNLPACGGQYTHGNARSAYEVPMMVWTNNAFRDAQPQWVAMADKQARHGSDGMPQFDNRVFAATIADVLGYAMPYPSLSAGGAPPVPRLDGRSYRERASADVCHVRSTEAPQ
jgi:glucan phosphoethanolaminetransferase (alkaline phosphatase superfamily)